MQSEAEVSSEGLESENCKEIQSVEEGFPRLISLPPEILIEICHYLDNESLGAIAKTCCLLRVVTHDEGLWKEKIKRDFQLDPDRRLESASSSTSTSTCDLNDFGYDGCSAQPESVAAICECSPFISARHYYTRFLQRLGRCAGFWWQKLEGVATRGCVLGIRFEGPNLVCHRITPSKTFTQNPDRQEFFVASLDDADLDKIAFHCAVGRKLFSLKLTDDKNCLKLHLEGQIRMPRIRAGINIFFHKQFGHWEIFQRLVLPTPPIVHTRQLQNLPETGIYQGSYRDLGSELVQVIIRDDPDNMAIYGRKLTGDQYVPPGEITFTCDLQTPLHPTSRQMQSMTSLRLASICQNSDCLCPIEFPFQPLHIPEDCRLDVPGYAYPSFALGWFKAAHVISYPNFTMPEDILAHLVVFGKTEFGLFIFQLNDRTVFNNLSVFRKVNLNDSK